MEQGEVETGLARPDWRDDIEWALLQRMGERTRGGPPMAPQAVAGKRRPTAREKPRIASSAAKSAPGAKVVGSGAPAKPQRAAKKDKAATSKAPKPRGSAAVRRSVARQPKSNGPRPNAKQPLGKKEVGSATLRWLGQATERVALEYVALYDQLSEAASYVDGLDGNDSMLQAMEPRFGMPAVLARVDELLEAGEVPPAEAAANVTRVRGHVPTVWASFSSAVRKLLQLRSETDEALRGGAASGSWSASAPWLLLRELYEGGKKEEGFLWKVDDPTAAAGSASRKEASPTKLARKQAKATDLAAKAIATASSFALAEQSTAAPRASDTMAAALSFSLGQASAGSSLPSWTRVTADGDVELLSEPLWGGEATAAAARSPLPARPALPGASALASRVEAYAEELLALLRLEREAALASAERAIVSSEQREADRMLASGKMTEAAGDEGEGEDDEGGDLGAAAASAAQAGTQSLLSERQARRLRGVRLSNVQSVSGKAGNRTLLTIAALSEAMGDMDASWPPREDRYKTKTRLPRSKLAIGDVVILRPPAAMVDSATQYSEATGQVLADGMEERVRGVVTQLSPGTLTIALEASPPYEQAPLTARGDSAPVAMSMTVARVRAWLGDEVRVDWLGSDVTHTRSLGALELLQRMAVEATQGKPSAPLSQLYSLFGAGSEEGPTAAPIGTPTDAAATARGSARFNTALEPSQLAAVESAMGGEHPVTVLQGPPGSGKSSVVIEIVRRAVAAGMRVLVSAPSNMAVDGLLLRLADEDETLRIVRLGNPERIDAAALNRTAARLAENRAPRVEEEAKLELQQSLAQLNANGRLSRQRKQQMRGYLRRNARRDVERRLARGPRETMAEAQVVLCTTTGAADRSVIDMPPFDLVVVDEAAQATSPNAWVPLLRGRRSVLVGDPQQLPPTLLSREAADGALGTSLMELAIKARPAAFSALDTQFRMHEAIGAWSSSSFYEGRLSAHPSAASRTLSELPGVVRNELTTAPLVGIRVGGERSATEERAANGEISNPAEASAVVAHVARLLRSGVAADALTIISPYSAQVALIKRSLERAAAQQRDDARADALGAIEVATVDAFQGREAEAVVISLTRSNRRGAIGFLRDRRRLNVAVTRARRHLAIVCDPTTVAADPLLADLMDHVAAVGEWRAAEQMEELPPSADAVRGVVIPSEQTQPNGATAAGPEVDAERR